MLRHGLYKPFIGNNNWPAIRAAISKVGYDGWLIAEMEARYHYAQDQQLRSGDIARLRVIVARSESGLVFLRKDKPIVLENLIATCRTLAKH